ncbi:MAG: BREX-3 system P-loop-containing protein BrxF [Fibrobacterota bacterium]|nr:BREX-3 system P-loop-containing protein BrxF [Fibrobacterota bacterium]
MSTSEKLDHLISGLGDLTSKLILLVGSSLGPRKGKSDILRNLGERTKATPLKVGIELGRSLSAISKNKRAFAVSELLRELSDQHAFGGLVLIDNMELLFDRDLQANPLNLLKQLAHSKRVVWPGRHLPRGAIDLRGKRSS